MAYMEGCFYCHFRRMTSFNIANQEWQIIRITYHPSYHVGWIIDSYEIFRFTNPNYLLECDGELLLASVSPLITSVVSLTSLMTNCFMICSVDWKNEGWMNGLRGGAIFICKTSFSISRGRETEIIANGVHHYSNGIPKFFLSVDCPWESLEESREKCKIC